MDAEEQVMEADDEPLDDSEVNSSVPRDHRPSNVITTDFFRQAMLSASAEHQQSSAGWTTAPGGAGWTTAPGVTEVSTAAPLSAN